MLLYEEQLLIPSPNNSNVCVCVCVCFLIACPGTTTVSSLDFPSKFLGMNHVYIPESQEQSQFAKNVHSRLD